MRKFLLPIVILLMVACNKDPLLDAAPSMVGTWMHFSSATDYHVIIVKEDGTGILMWYNEKGLYKDTKSREWLYKDNTMYFGKVALNGELYDIDEYPVTAGSTFIEGYDTIPSGRRFCVLDNGYYKELE